MRESRSSGSVGGKDGNILAYPANGGIIRSPVRAFVLPDRSILAGSLAVAGISRSLSTMTTDFSPSHS
jgi:hypothetical protein